MKNVRKITKKDHKRNAWVRQKTHVTVEIHKIKTLKRKWSGHLVRTGNRWIIRIAQWYPRNRKKPTELT